MKNINEIYINKISQFISQFLKHYLWSNFDNDSQANS